VSNFTSPDVKSSSNSTSLDVESSSSDSTSLDVESSSISNAIHPAENDGERVWESGRYIYIERGRSRSSGRERGREGGRGRESGREGEGEIVTSGEGSSQGAQDGTRPADGRGASEKTKEKE
jgi:hypothetical protein